MGVLKEGNKCGCVLQIIGCVSKKEKLPVSDCVLKKHVSGRVLKVMSM